MFEVIVSARVQNHALNTGWQRMGVLVIHTSTDRLNAEKLVENPGSLLPDYKLAKELLLQMYPGAYIGMEVRRVV